MDDDEVIMHGTTSRILQKVDRGSREIVQRLQHLQDIGAALSAEQDLGKLLALILRESRGLLNADSGSVFVRQDEVETVANATARDEIYRITPFLFLKVAQNDSLHFPFKEMRLPFDQKTIAGHVAVTGEVINLPDVYKIPAGTLYSYSTAFDEISGYRCRSMLVVPMRNRDGEIIGVLQLINKKIDAAVKLEKREGVERYVQSFDPVDEELALSLASQAAVCIEKAKLYEEIEKMFEGLVTSFTLSLEKRNRTTYGHCLRVAKYAIAIAEAVNAEPQRFGGFQFTMDMMRQLRYGGLLHDIGKIAVPEAILDKRNKLLDSEIETIAYRFAYWKTKVDAAKAKKLDAWMQDIRKINIPKPLDEGYAKVLDEIRAEKLVDLDGKEKPLLSDSEYENLAIRRGNLTPAERKMIEQHIVDTWEILKRIPWPKSLRYVAHIAATHHEKVNGSGYPWGFTVKDLPLERRILPMVDIYEALTAKDRPYKPAMPVDKALKVLQDEVDRGNLDKDLYQLFLDKKIYMLFSGESGFVGRPDSPVTEIK